MNRPFHVFLNRFAPTKRSSFINEKYLDKRNYENNPLAKQLANWKGLSELENIEHGSPMWNLALFEYLMKNADKKDQLHDLLAMEVIILNNLTKR